MTDSKSRDAVISRSVGEPILFSIDATKVRAGRVRM
jgi:hypothetical protein